MDLKADKIKGLLKKGWDFVLQHKAVFMIGGLGVGLVYLNRIRQENLALLEEQAATQPGGGGGGGFGGGGGAAPPTDTVVPDTVTPDPVNTPPAQNVTPVGSVVSGVEATVDPGSGSVTPVGGSVTNTGGSTTTTGGGRPPVSSVGLGDLSNNAGNGLGIGATVTPTTDPVYQAPVKAAVLSGGAVKAGSATQASVSDTVKNAVAQNAANDQVVTAQLHATTPLVKTSSLSQGGTSIPPASSNVIVVNKKSVASTANASPASAPVSSGGTVTQSTTPVNTPKSVAAKAAQAGQAVQAPKQVAGRASANFLGFTGQKSMGGGMNIRLGIKPKYTRRKHPGLIKMSPGE